MKSLIIYYSYTGNTKKNAEQMAKKQGCDLCEITDVKRPSTIKAYTAGCFAAMRQKKWPVNPPGADFGAYGKIILMAPIWAGFPAPQLNSVIDLLPSGKIVSLFLVSASGQSKGRDKVSALIKQRDCKVSKYQDLKSSR